jgi:hypothetical protein
VGQIIGNGTIGLFEGQRRISLADGFWCFTCQEGMDYRAKAYPSARDDHRAASIAANIVRHLYLPGTTNGRDILYHAQGMKTTTARDQVGKSRRIIWTACASPGRAGRWGTEEAGVRNCGLPGLLGVSK